eukprot:scaffold49019_cov63-Phaeocystis_antarctica.AAC.3
MTPGSVPALCGGAVVLQLSLGERKAGMAPLVGCAGPVTGTEQCVGQPPERCARGEDQQRCGSCRGCPWRAARPHQRQLVQRAQK